LIALDGTRELVIGRTPYFIVYRHADERIEIIALIHGARAWPVR
jgi:plasmid stabilization system protein ParE